MKVEDKTKEQLISEFEEMRRRVAELEKSETERKRAEEELGRYKLIVSAVHDPMSFIDSNYVYRTVNDAYTKIFKKTREEIIGLSVAEMFGKEIFEKQLKGHLDRCFAGEEVHYRDWLDFPDGKRRCMHIGYYPFFDNDESLSGVVVNARDMTDLVLAEEALRESEERFRHAFENASVGMCLVDNEGRFIKVNNQMCEIFGYSQGELEAMTVNDITHPDYLDVSPRFIQRASSGEISQAEFEKQYYHKKGHIVWGQVTSSLVRDDSGAPLYFISHVKDITERKQAEDALRKRTHDLSERRKELNCLYGISELTERQDFSREELLQAIVNLIPPAWQYPEITCARLIVEGAEYRGASFRETMWKLAKDITVHGERVGTVEVFYLEERSEADEGPFLQEERSLINAIAERLGRILERTIAEEEVQQAYDHLGMQVKLRTAELAKTNEELRIEIAERKRVEEALRNSSEKFKLFASSVIHDIKSPAVGIYGLTELLHKHYKDSLDERGKNYCDQILKATVHLASLIERINAYISAKESPLKIEKMDVKEILQIIREEFSPRLTIRQIAWLEPETMPEIKADKLSMLRVFRNFVDNALKYGGDNLSEITAGYNDSEEYHIISINDNGAGMRAGDFERFFTPFQRDATREGIEGSGLGLAIVREIAERHRGRVWAEPGQDKGITFYISLSKDL